MTMDMTLFSVCVGLFSGSIHWLYTVSKLSAAMAFEMS